LIGLGWIYHEDVDNIELAQACYVKAEALVDGLQPGQLTETQVLATRAFLAFVKSKVAQKLHNLPDAKSFVGESLQLYAALGQQWSTASPQLLMGEVCLQMKQYGEARHHLEHALRLMIERRMRLRAYVLRWLGLLDFELGNLEEARKTCLESLQESERIQDRNVFASDFGLLAAIYAKQSQPLRAARLSGASSAMWTRQKRKPWEDSSLDTLLPGWRDRPEAAVIQQAFDEGHSMSSDEAVAYALGDQEARR
jgi:tetratricopeptide (TPR) repeat protein